MKKKKNATRPIASLAIITRRVVLMLFLFSLTTVMAWGKSGKVTLTPHFIKDKDCNGVSAIINMHDHSSTTGLNKDATLTEDHATEISYTGEDNHEITISCALTGDEGKNIEINYKMMLTYQNGQMAPATVEKDAENNAIVKVSLGHPAMYNSQKFIVKEMEFFIILNDMPMPDGILRSKDEKIDNSFLFSWKEQYKKVMDNKYEAKPLDWDYEKWWVDFTNGFNGYNNEYSDWYYEEDMFQLWKGFFMQFENFKYLKDLKDLKIPIKYAWDTFTDWSQEKLLQGFGFTKTTYDWFTRYKSWRWGTRRISSHAKVQCSDTRLTQHQEWRFDSGVKRIVNDIKSNLRVYKALKGSTVKVIADEGWRVASITFRDKDGNMPGSVDFESANNQGSYYKNTDWHKGRQILVMFSNFNAPSSEVTLKIGEDFLFPEMEVKLLKENYSEFEQATYEVKTATHSLLRLVNYPDDYPLYTGFYIRDFAPNITYKADDNTVFNGTWNNGYTEIEGDIRPAGPTLSVEDGNGEHYMFEKEDWGHAVVFPIKEGETNIYASMKPGWGYAAAPNVAKTHLVVRGFDPQLHFSVAHISKLASELGVGPDLFRSTGTYNANVTFASSDPEVVTVTKNGKLGHTLQWAGGYGTVVISASQPTNGIYTAGYASYELTVRKPMDTSFIVDNKVYGLDNLTYDDPYLPVFRLKDGDYNMQEDHDFTVSYRNTSNNQISSTAPSKSGTYEVLFTGKDIYDGTVVGATFTIAPLDMVSSGYTIDAIPDVHGGYAPQFVLRKNGVEIDHNIIGTINNNTAYAQSYDSEMQTWQPGTEHTLTITALHVPDVTGSISKTFFYSYKGNGTQENPYQISNTALFNYLAQEVNSGKDMSGVYFKLTANIDAPEATIGSIDHPFAGFFDGNNKIITNATKAIFGRLMDNATVKNLMVVGTTSETGAIALWNEGTLQNNYFHTDNSSLNGLAGVSGSGNTDNDGAVRVYKVAYDADGMNCSLKTSCVIEYNNAKYYKDNTNINVSLTKKGHEDDTPTFYLNIGSLANASENNAGDNSLTINGADVDIKVAYTPFIQNGWISLAQESYEYNGAENCPVVTVNNGTANLTEADYDVAYEDNINAGTAKVIVTGKGSYTGQAVKTFTITPRTDASIAMDDWYEVHTIPEPVITCEALGKTLVKDQDYVLVKCRYNNTPSLADEYAELTIQFVGNFSGQVVKQYKTHYWKGAGTAEDPFQITNSRQLVYLSEESNSGGPRVSYLEAYYKVMNDIDMDGISFRPICDRNEGEVGNFFGVFDGNNKVISNLTISEGTNATGFFGRNYAGTLKNIVLKNVTANVTDVFKPTALLVGANQHIIKDCIVQGTLPADSKVTCAIVDYNHTNYELSLVNNYYHVDGKDDVHGTYSKDVTENNGAVGLVDFVLADEVSVSNVTYSDTYDLFGTAYHKNGSTATMTLAYTGSTLTNPMFYVENGNLVDNGNGTHTLTFEGPATIIATTGVDMADAEIELSETEYTFDPLRTKAVEPAVTVTIDGKTLVQSDDYELSYTDNMNAGVATVTVTGKKMYTGSKKAYFSIAPLDFADNAMMDDIPNIFYQGEDTEEPAIALQYYLGISHSPVALTEGTDYTVTYTNSKEVGTAYATITGMGNYAGSFTRQYNITDLDFTKCVIDCPAIPYRSGGWYADVVAAVTKVTSTKGDVTQELKSQYYDDEWNVQGDWELTSEIKKCEYDEDAKEWKPLPDEEQNPYLDLSAALTPGTYQLKAEGIGLWAGSKTFLLTILDASTLPALTLYDDQANVPMLDAYEAYYDAGDYNWLPSRSPAVTFKDRVLYKDGDWNTICLPFDLTKAELDASPLAGCILKSLNTEQTTFDKTTGDLTLWFDDVTEPSNADDPFVEAGTPYLIKWAKPEGYVAYDGTNAASCSDIVEPVFVDVPVKHSASLALSDDGSVTFKGSFDPEHLYDNPHTRYYLGANNTLFYPKNSFVQLNAFRAYFELDMDEAVYGIRSVNFNFGDETEGIMSVNRSDNAQMVWFDLSGRKLSGKPSAKGLFLNMGKKVVIK